MKNIKAVVASVRQAILDENAEELLRNITRTEGLICTDSLYSYTEAKTFLHDKKSHLYLSLFDSVGFSRRCTPEFPSDTFISDKEFLRTAREPIEITLLDSAWVKVTLTSKAFSYPLEWHLHREGGTWRLGGNSFTIGACECG